MRKDMDYALKKADDCYYAVVMGEGFQSSLPNAEARVLVWGNHSGVMTRTLGWLHDRQISAVDPSWIEKIDLRTHQSPYSFH